MNVAATYACYNKDDEVRILSSSGAIFSLLASNIFKYNGVVYGVAMSEDCYTAEFVVATNNSELEKIRGSKYLQAKVGDTYKAVKRDLCVGKLVLFTGTGCQINGLKNFLGQDYDNLICVDVICHGVPSPALWKKYVAYQEKKYKTKLESINFRCKDKSWSEFGIKENQLYISKDKDAYMQMFLRDYCLRPSCYECVAKKNKMADISIADFWGIDNIAPEMNDNKGTSLVLVRTQKGKRIFEEIQDEMYVKIVKYEEGVRSNPAEYKSAVRPAERNKFFEEMRNIDFESLKKKYARPIKTPLTRQIKQKIKIILKSIAKNKWGGVERNYQEYGLLFTFEKRLERY